MSQSGPETNVYVFGVHVGRQHAIQSCSSCSSPDTHGWTPFASASAAAMTIRDHTHSSGH